MNKVTLLIGGNQGDRYRLIDQATEQIRQRIGSVVALSRVYETEPWGTFEDTLLSQPCQAASSPNLGEVAAQRTEECVTPNFLNRALAVETSLSPLEVLREALAIEKELGRVRSPRPHQPQAAATYHSRPMDIDLIFYDDVVTDTPELTLPHPRMHLRRFVLEPLAEIMPEYRHPLLGKTINELLSELCDD